MYCNTEVGFGCSYKDDHGGVKMGFMTVTD